MSTPIFLSGITKRFGAGSAATTAVDNVSLDIHDGELFFLLGPSGCGKTTLLRMIAGFIDPTAGSIRFADRDVTFEPPNKRNTGMVFQSYALWPHMTVEQNVAFGLTVRKVPGPDRRRRVAEALAAVRMDPYAQRKPNQLSGGQQQRVALARAIVVRPDVLLLDEPLSNLDAKLRIELRSEIRRVCKQSGITTVYVTHDQKEALSMADRVAIMRAGRVEQLGAPAHLYRSPRSRFVAEFLGETNLIPGAVTSVDPRGVHIDSPAGPITGRPADPDSPPTPGSRVLCSVRPESIKVRAQNDATATESEPGGRGNGGGGNTIRGRVSDSVYLGEIAHHEVTIGSAENGANGDDARRGLTLRVAQLNPTGAAHERDLLHLSIDPADVVILPAD